MKWGIVSIWNCRLYFYWRKVRWIYFGMDIGFLLPALSVSDSSDGWDYAFTRKGGVLRVLHRSQLLAVTINPQAPSGLVLDSQQLQQAMEESLKLPVYDVKG